MVKQAVRDVRLDLTRAEWKILMTDTMALKEIYLNALKKVDNQKTETVEQLRESFDRTESFLVMLNSRVSIIDDTQVG